MDVLVLVVFDCDVNRVDGKDLVSSNCSFMLETNSKKK